MSEHANQQPGSNPSVNNNHSPAQPGTHTTSDHTLHASAKGLTPLKMPNNGSPSNLPVAPGTPGTPGAGPGPTPVPQTPMGAPPAGMGSPGSMPASAFEVDLPPELLHQGWRKFWSRRENRPYFFNRASGDTMWEMPPIHGAGAPPPGGGPPPQVFERNSDPLGISNNGPPPPGPPGPPHGHPGGHPVGHPGGHPHHHGPPGQHPHPGPHQMHPPQQHPGQPHQHPHGQVKCQIILL